MLQDDSHIPLKMINVWFLAIEKKKIQVISMQMALMVINKYIVNSTEIITAIQL